MYHMRCKVKKKLFCIIFLSVIGIFMISLGVYHTAKQEKKFNPEWGTLQEGEGSNLIEKLEKTIYEGEIPPEYYAGCYVLKQNLIVLIKEGYKDKELEVRNVLGENDVYIQYVEYSLRELNEAQQVFSEKYESIYKKGNEKERKILQKIVSSGVRNQENRVVITLRNGTKKDVRKIKALVGNNKMIIYQYK